MITKRTSSIPISVTDIPEILEMYVEKDSFKYVRPLKNKTREEYTKFLQKKISGNSPVVGFWVVRDKVTQEFIGTMNLNTLPNMDRLQIGCHLKRKYWNQGYATELMQQLLVYAFEIRKVETLYGFLEEANLASKKMLQNLGFTWLENQNYQGIDLAVYHKSSPHSS